MQELQIHVRKGVSAFVDGDYAKCLQELAPIVKYFATDQMTMAVMISLRRLGAFEELANFRKQFSSVDLDSQFLQQSMDVILGEIDGEQLLPLLDDDVQRCQMHFYIASYLAGVGRVQEAMPHLRQSVDSSVDCLESDAARAELARREISALSESDWLLLVTKRGRLIDDNLKVGSWGKAADLVGSTAQLLRIHPDATHWELLPVLETLTHFSARTGQFDVACEMLEREVKVLRRLHGMDHDSLILPLTNYGVMLQNLGQHRRAEAVYIEALDLCRRLHRTRTPEEALLLNYLGFLCAGQGRYKEAESYYNEALQSARFAHGEGHDEYAQTLKNLGDLFVALNRHAEAIEYHQQALSVRRRLLGDHRFDVAQSLNDLAVSYAAKDEFEMAVSLARQAVDLFASAVGEQHPEYATALGTLGALLLRSGTPTEAVELLMRAREVMGGVLSADDSSLLLTTINLAEAHNRVGDRQAAHSLFEGLAALLRRRGSLPDDRVMNALAKVGNFLYESGDYWEAEQVYQLVITFFEDRPNTLHSGYLISLNGLAVLYTALGRTDEAFAITEPVLQLLSETGQTKTMEYAIVLNNLAEAHRVAGHFDRAVVFYHRSLDLRSQLGSDDDSKTATVLNNLALTLMSLGKWGEAESFLRRAMKLDEEQLGSSSAAYAIDLHNLGELCSLTDRPDDAISFYEKAISIRRTTRPDGDPEVPQWLFDLAVLHYGIGRRDSARALMQEALEIDDRSIGQVFAISSDSLRLKHIRKVDHRYHFFLWLTAIDAFGDKASAERAYIAVLRRKGLLWEALSMQQDQATPGNYPDLQAPLHRWLGDGYVSVRDEYGQLKAVNREMSRVILQGPNSEDPATHDQKVAELTARREELEKRIARRLPQMDVAKALHDITVGQVATHLPASSVLVEFVRVQPPQGLPPNVHADGRYIAFILSSTENLHVLDLGEAQQIDRMIADFRETVSLFPTSAEWTDRSAGEALRIAVFSKLPELAGQKTIYIALDGDFYLLPFETLPDGDHHLLLDNYQFSYLGSGRDLIRQAKRAGRRSRDPVVIADPTFNLAADGPVPQGTRSIVSSPQATEDQNSRLKRGFRFGPLKYTRIEGEQIATLLGVTPWIGAGALEGRLRQVESPRILHIATHGFFLKEPLQLAADQPNRGRLTAEGMEDPMLRSGIALAGANLWLAGGTPPAEAEDGLLTAADAAELNLSGTELVVLSACETGLGEVRNGEGVFGMRRAFTLAGTRTVVMSLWKVQDGTTKDLMLEFYRRILSSEPIGDALRQAQLIVKQTHPHPYYWGAFICQGYTGLLQQ